MPICALFQARLFIAAYLVLLEINITRRAVRLMISAVVNFGSMGGTILNTITGWSAARSDSSSAIGWNSASRNRW
jgi:hypothetical protein